MGIASHIGKFFGGAILGATVGGTLGALFAPDKGVRTRKKLSEKSEDFKVSMKEKISDLLDEIKEKLGTANADKSVERAKSKVNAVKKVTRRVKADSNKTIEKAKT